MSEAVAEATDTATAPVNTDNLKSNLATALKTIADQVTFRSETEKTVFMAAMESLDSHPGDFMTLPEALAGNVGSPAENILTGFQNTIEAQSKQIANLTKLVQEMQATQAAVDNAGTEPAGIIPEANPAPAPGQ